MATTRRRRIGTIGTTSRVLGGLGLLHLALADGLAGGLAWHEAVLGLAAFPAVMLALGLAAGRWILRRDDQIGCPTFTPIDVVEARLNARNRRHPTHAHSGAA